MSRRDVGVCVEAKTTLERGTAIPAYDFALPNRNRFQCTRPRTQTGWQLPRSASLAVSMERIDTLHNGGLGIGSQRICFSPERSASQSKLDPYHATYPRAGKPIRVGTCLQQQHSQLFRGIG